MAITQLTELPSFRAILDKINELVTGVNAGGDSVTVATGAEVNTGTDNTKVVTPKAVADSNIIMSANGTVQNVITITKAAYDALSSGERAGNTYLVTDEVEVPVGLATPTANGLQSMSDKGAMNILTAGPVVIVNTTTASVIDDYITMNTADGWSCSKLMIYTWGAMVYCYAVVARSVGIGPGNVTNENIFTWTTLGLKYSPFSAVSISTASSGPVANGYLNTSGANMAATDLAATSFDFGVTYLRDSIYDD